MGKISKKQISKIQHLIIFTDVIVRHDYGRNIAEKHWTDTPPDMWSKNETEIYDMMVELEMKLKEEILKILL